VSNPTRREAAGGRRFRPVSKPTRRASGNLPASGDCCQEHCTDFSVLFWMVEIWRDRENEEANIYIVETAHDKTKE
jgi:hypothetical protein